MRLGFWAFEVRAFAVRAFALRAFSVLAFSVLALGLLTGPSAKANEGALYCVCTGNACGNNAVGGNQGDIFGQLTAEVVEDKFYSTGDTGWTCLVPAKVRGSGGPKGCYCGDQPCGNGGIGGDPLFIDLGLSESEVANKYGGGKKGNKTGWLCGPYRGTVN